MEISPSDGAFDVIVIGAGPAGLAAATTAGSHGASVALIDAGREVGGQYWRQLGGQDADRAALAHLHHDLATFRRLTDLLSRQQTSGSTAHLPNHHVWAVERIDDQNVVHAVDWSGTAERDVTVTGRRLVIATGAYDRQVPFPGWDLPGVMTAGGAQALLKGHGVVAGQRVVVAGTGPFLLPVAAGLANSGADVVGVYEAASVSSWARHGRTVARNLAKVGEGLAHATTLVRHRVPVRTRAVLIAAHGIDAVEAVSVLRSGRVERIECDTLAVGWGFTPQLELPLALGCQTRVDADGSVVTQTADDQRTSVEGVYVAGETCGVGGSDLALVEGTIAGAAAAGGPGVGRTLRRRRSALRQFAHAMHRAHPVPSEWMTHVEPSTVICRCEEISSQDLRHAVDEGGAVNARAAKLLTRAGMGWCQGRVCGYAVACLVAGWGGSPYSPELIGSRPIASPVTLGALAAEHTRTTVRPLRTPLTERADPTPP